MIFTFDPKRTINVEALSDALKALAPAVSGITVIGDMVDARRRFVSRLEVVLSTSLTPEQDTAIRNAINAHNADTLTVGQVAEDTRKVARNDARQRFLQHAIAGKTPEQIYTLIQGEIDGWASLTDAKNDLRAWLPLLASAVAWLVIEE